MAAGPTWPAPSERSRAEPVGDEAAGQAEHGERCMVLEITRDVKEDGRALILYTRAGGETT